MEEVSFQFTIIETMDTKLGYVSLKTYTVEEVADKLHIPFWDLQVVCRFMRVPKVGGKFTISEELMKYLRQMHRRVKPEIV